MKKGWLIGLLVLTFAIWSNSCCSKSKVKPFKNEPDGFRGIKWGTHLSRLSEVNFVYRETWVGLKKYTRKLDNPSVRDIENYLNVRGVEADRIVYWFWQDKFYKAEILFSDYSNFITLKNFCLTTYGQPYEKEGSLEKTFYCWGGPHGGNIAIVRLIYFAKSDGGVLSLESVDILKQYVDSFGK